MGRNHQRTNHGMVSKSRKSVRTLRPSKLFGKFLQTYNSSDGYFTNILVCGPVRARLHLCFSFWSKRFKVSPSCIFYSFDPVQEVKFGVRITRGRPVFFIFWKSTWRSARTVRWPPDAIIDHVLISYSARSSAKSIYLQLWEFMRERENYRVPCATVPSPPTTSDCICWLCVRCVHVSSAPFPWLVLCFRLEAAAAAAARHSASMVYT